MINTIVVGLGGFINTLIIDSACGKKIIDDFS